MNICEVFLISLKIMTFTTMEFGTLEDLENRITKKSESMISCLTTKYMIQRLTMITRFWTKILICDINDRWTVIEQKQMSSGAKV